MSFRLKQIGLALFLMTSLLVAGVSACTCSHHQETAESFHDLGHGSHGESIENAKHSLPRASSDDEYVCVANVRAQSVLAKSDIKELKVSESISNSDQVMPDPEFLAVSTVQAPKSEYAGNFSYSTDYQAFRPSRAPPRL